jgi:hypothetical protein
MGMRVMSVSDIKFLRQMPHSSQIVQSERAFRDVSHGNAALACPLGQRRTPRCHEQKLNSFVAASLEQPQHLLLASAPSGAGIYMQDAHARPLSDSARIFIAYR